MMVIMAVATDPRAIDKLAAVAIGGAVALDALWGGPISGASMNPARSFGPALITGTWTDHWIYWIAPILGMLLGAGLYQWVCREQSAASKAFERAVSTKTPDEQQAIIHDEIETLSPNK
jgi:glycerol uptake facilitator-like aquaporin